jgi:hypothetical protein
MVVHLASGHRLPKKAVFWGIRYLDSETDSFIWRMSEQRYTNPNDAVRACFGCDGTNAHELYNLGRSPTAARNRMHQLRPPNKLATG